MAGAEAKFILIMPGHAKRPIEIERKNRKY